MTRKPRQDASDDPVVREVRAIRRRLWEEGGKTVRGYLRVMEEMSRERQATAQTRTSPRRRKSA